MSATIIGSAPILLVEDVVASADYYRQRLGFRSERFWGKPPDSCILQRDGCRPMLSQVADPGFVAPHHKAFESMWNVYFRVDDAAA